MSKFSVSLLYCTNMPHILHFQSVHLFHGFFQICPWFSLQCQNFSNCNRNFCDFFLKGTNCSMILSSDSFLMWFNEQKNVNYSLHSSRHTHLYTGCFFTTQKNILKTLKTMGKDVHFWRGSKYGYIIRV